jgi:UDP-N-acetylmuramate: L-alanyl-gamma-D-glutamyl-meso-diaminopimelate ligase
MTVKRVIPQPQNLERIKRIHLSAICGMGMGSLAGLLKDRGMEVSGSDQNVYPPMSTQLEKKGILLQEGYESQRLQDVDLVIIGNAISRGNVELEYALENAIPCLSFPEALHLFFLKDSPAIVVTGTHGKTTTSAICAWILNQCGKKSSFCIGGVLANYDCSYQLGEKQSPFVVEGDEYDSACFDKRPKIVHYPADAAILTSIEFDHADIYQNLEQIKKQFRNFTQNLNSEKLLLAYGEDANVREVLQGCSARIEFYGFNSSDLTWSATSILEGPNGVHFDLKKDQKKIGTFRSPLLGRHNLNNLLAALGVVGRYGIEPKEAMTAMQEFKGIFRRQQVRAVIGGITVMDDFAHHPTAVKLTLEAIRQGYPQGRLWAVFEPRTATSRRKVFQESYVQSFGSADRIVVAPVYRAEVLAEKERFSSEKLVKELKRMGKQAHYLQGVSSIIDHLVKGVSAGDTVVILSNGGFEGIHERLIQSLEKNRG